MAVNFLDLISNLLGKQNDNTLQAPSPTVLQPRNYPPVPEPPKVYGVGQDPNAPVSTNVDVNQNQLQMQPTTQTAETPTRLQNLQSIRDRLASGEQIDSSGNPINFSRKTNLLENLSQGLREGGLAGAVLGGGAGLIEPKSIQLQARHQQALAQNQKDIANELGQQNVQSEIESRNAENEYKATLPQATQINQQLRAEEIQRKSDYDNASLKLRQDVLNGNISYRDWQQKQKDIDNQFKERQLTETARHNQATETNAANRNAQSGNSSQTSVAEADALDDVKSYNSAQADTLRSQLPGLIQQQKVAEAKKDSATYYDLDRKIKEAQKNIDSYQSKADEAGKQAGLKRAKAKVSTPVSPIVRPVTRNTVKPKSDPLGIFSK